MQSRMNVSRRPLPPKIAPRVASSQSGHTAAPSQDILIPHLLDQLFHQLSLSFSPAPFAARLLAATPTASSQHLTRLTIVDTVKEWSLLASDKTAFMNQYQSCQWIKYVDAMLWLLKQVVHDEDLSELFQLKLHKKQEQVQEINVTDEWVDQLSQQLAKLKDSSLSSPWHEIKNEKVKRPFVALPLVLDNAPSEKWDLPLNPVLQEWIFIEEALNILLVLPSLFPSNASFSLALTPYATTFPFFQALAQASEKVNQFIQQTRYDQGCVLHALTAGLNDYLQHYYTLIGQLEHQHRHGGHLTLTRAIYYLQEMHHLFCRLLAPLVDFLSSHSCTGGALLSLLEERFHHQSGDPLAKRTWKNLLERASAPFEQQLRSWLTGGVLEDPFDEFMISMTAASVNDDDDAYWQQRFIIKEEAQVPSAWWQERNKILQTGKYWQLLKDAGKEVKQEREKSHSLPDLLSHQWTVSSKAVFELFYPLPLLQSLERMKHLFFMDASDVHCQWLSLSEDALCLERRQVPVSRVQRLLEMEWRHVGWDERGVNVVMMTLSLKSQLERISEAHSGPMSAPLVPSSGWDALCLDVQFPFPLSIIYNRKIVLKYQLLFRFLLLWKRLEMKWSLMEPFSRLKKLNFIRAFYLYATQVLETHYQRFLSLLSSNNLLSLDQVMLLHHDYLDSCLKECLLTHARLLPCLWDILETLQQTEKVTFQDDFDSKVKQFIPLLQYSATTDHEHYLSSVNVCR